MDIIDLSSGHYTINIGKNKNIHRKYEITFNISSEKIINSDDSSYIISFYENEIVNLKLSNGRDIACFVSYKSYGKDKGDIFLSKKIGENIDESVKLESIALMPHIKFRNLKLASVDNVKSSNVEIYLKNRIIDFDDSSLIGINIVNNLNGASIYVDKSNVIYHYDKEEEAIHINREQRMMIDLELPSFINQYYLDIINDDRLNKYYVDENQNISYTPQDDFTSVKKEVNMALCDSKHNIFQLSIYPVFKTVEMNKSTTNRFFNHYLKWLIRIKTKTKVVIRPYSIDESDKVVRLTNNSLKQIGVDENDFIVLRNPINKKSLKVKAMSMDDETAIYQENRVISSQYLNLCIGVPLHIRNELKLESLNSTVEIERDLVFIFKKHLNSQIQSLIGVLLSFIAIKEYIENEFIVVGISIVFLAILVFISFSDIREKIDE